MDSWRTVCTILCALCRKEGLRIEENQKGETRSIYPCNCTKQN